MPKFCFPATTRSSLTEPELTQQRNGLQIQSILPDPCMIGPDLLYIAFFFYQSVMVWWTEPRCKSTKSTSVPTKNNPSGGKKSNNKKHSRRSKKQKRRDGIKTSPCCQCAGLRVVPKRTKKKVCFQKVRKCWALEEKHSREGRSKKLVTLLKVSLITFSGEATIRRWGAGIEAASVNRVPVLKRLLDEDGTQSCPQQELGSPLPPSGHEKNKQNNKGPVSAIMPPLKTRHTKAPWALGLVVALALH